MLLLMCKDTGIGIQTPDLVSYLSQSYLKLHSSVFKPGSFDVKLLHSHLPNVCSCNIILQLHLPCPWKGIFFDTQMLKLKTFYERFLLKNTILIF